jgi:hypothetical protein
MALAACRVVDPPPPPTTTTSSTTTTSTTTTTTTILSYVDVVAGGSTDVAAVGAGGVYTVTGTVSNAGNLTETGTIGLMIMAFSDQAVGNVSAGAGWTCSVAGSAVECSNESDLAPGATLTPVVVQLTRTQGSCTRQDATVYVTSPGNELLPPGGYSGGGGLPEMVANNSTNTPVVCS